MSLVDLGVLLKKVSRQYSKDITDELKGHGFINLRASFVEILSYLCIKEHASIKEIGEFCGLKKQTMTSHLKELESRGYVIRADGEKDKREQIISLTKYGEDFKVALEQASSNVERLYTTDMSKLELQRLFHQLEAVEKAMNNSSIQQKKLI